MIDLNTNTQKTRAILAGLNTGSSFDEYMASMRELKDLAVSAGLCVVSQIVQNAPAENHKTHLGSGKVLELKTEIELCDASLVLFNENLTPMQMRDLEKELDTEVFDRTGIILQIFAMRAKTREAKLQVQSAHLQYMLPRLVGMRRNLSRQGGGSGRLSNKGLGEEKIELDRRHIEHQLARINAQLKEIEKERSTQRSRRSRSNLPLIALVGYTNAGKSTLMNRFLMEGTAGGACDGNKNVYAEDRLFATLDTQVRRIQIPSHAPFLLSDTVGFITDLPHTLVSAFRSTLSEICYADLLLEVIDSSDPRADQHQRVTSETLAEIGAGDIPLIRVFNKADLCRELSIPSVFGDRIYMSAADGTGIPELLSLMEEKLYPKEETSYLLPYSEGALLHELSLRYPSLSPDYRPDGVSIFLRPTPRDAGRLGKYEKCS